MVLLVKTIVVRSRLGWRQLRTNDYGFVRENPIVNYGKKRDCWNS